MDALAPRQKGMKGDGLVRGLRLEPDLAAALRAYSVQQGLAHGMAPNMAAAARDLLRKGLVLCSGEHSCQKEGYFAGLAEARKRIGEATHAG